MGKFYAFLLGVIAGMALYHLGSTYHVVQSKSGWHVIPKFQQGWEDTYADIRHYTPGDWADHARLAAAIAESDNKSLKESVLDSTADSVLDSVLPSTETEGAKADTEASG